MKHGCLILADAHHNMLEGLRKLLHGLFDVVVMVADERSLAAAISALEHDLVIVDLSLPASGQGTILRRLRSLCETLPAKVIALSVHDEAEAVREALSAGAAGFVLKRSATTDLIPAVRAVLRGRTYVSPAAE